jgi:hypothetical protein
VAALGHAAQRGKANIENVIRPGEMHHDIEPSAESREECGATL